VQRLRQAIFALSVAVAPIGAVAAAGEVPPEWWDMAAVARVFSARYGVRAINVSGPQTAEALDAGQVYYRFGRSADAACTFEMRRPSGELFAAIAFDRLTDEYAISAASYGDVEVTIMGRERAVCDRWATPPGTARCYDRFIARRSPSAVPALIRAFQFIFSNVCTPVRLPPY
jgi:hypothetical protein